MKKGSLLAGVIVVALCGCNKGSDPGNTIVVQGGTVKESGSTSSTQSTDTGTANPAGSPTKGATPPVAGGAQHKQSRNTAEPPPTATWQPDTEPAMDLAKAVDEKMAGLKNTEARVDLRYQSAGGRGASKLEETIQDGKVFHLEYPVISDVKEQELTKARFIANGETAAVIGIDGPKMRQPVQALKMDTKAPLDKWPTLFPQFVFTPICGGHPFEDLVAEAQKPNSGVKVITEKASFDHSGKTYRQQRIRIEKSSPASGVFGMIVTFDSTYMVPIRIDAEGGTSEAKKSVVSWDTGWNFHPRLPFTRSLFDLPKS